MIGEAASSISVKTRNVPLQTHQKNLVGMLVCFVCTISILGLIVGGLFGGSDTRKGQNATSTRTQLASSMQEGFSPLVRENEQTQRLRAPFESSGQNLRLEPRFSSAIVEKQYGLYYVLKENGELWRYLSNNAYSETYLPDEVLMSDVKAFYCSSSNAYAIFALKNNGELWARGSNQNGLLGDNTGVNRDDWILVLSDVACIKKVTQYQFAIKNDGSLWRWGNGIYAPEKIADNAVDVYSCEIPSNVGFVRAYFYLTSNGTLYQMDELNKEPLLSGIRDWIQVSKYHKYDYVIAADNSLWRLPRAQNRWDSWNSTYVPLSGDNMHWERIFEHVHKVICNGDDLHRLYLITDSSECWAWGVGGLGDGTLIDRDLPVKILDNVRNVIKSLFLMNDGTVYQIDSKLAVPVKLEAEGITTMGITSPGMWLADRAHFINSAGLWVECILSDYRELDRIDGIFLTADPIMEF